MRNKIYGIVLLLIMAFSLFPATLAQDNETTSDTQDTVTAEDEAQIKDFDISHGAEMRLLQLERSLMRNILIGAEVVVVIEENNTDANTTELNLILDDMEDLLNEVRNMSLEGNASELAQQFVEIKKSATELTQEFKKESKKYLTSEDIADVREAIKNQKDELKDIDEQILEKRRELNAYRVEKVLEYLGASNPELVDKIKNGEATMAEVKAAIREEFRAMNGDEKINALKQFKSRIVQKTALRNTIKNKVKENVPQKINERRREKLSKRLEKRSNWLEVQSNKIERRSRVLEAAGLEKRSDKLEKISDALENKSDKLEQKSDNAGHKGNGKG